jgi:hypothetical protein
MGFSPLGILSSTISSSVKYPPDFMSSFEYPFLSNCSTMKSYPPFFNISLDISFSMVSIFDCYLNFSLENDASFMSIFAPLCAAS